MNRHPFANYDSWLEGPYQEAEDRAARQEWIDENTTYTTDCPCDEPVSEDVALPLLAKFREIAKANGGRGYGWTDAENDAVCVTCPKCKERTEVAVHEPAEPDDEADCENGGDGRDD